MIVLGPDIIRGGPNRECRFWRHAAHPAAVDWQSGHGLVVGSDMGTLEYYTAARSFGQAARHGRSCHPTLSLVAIA